MITWAPGYRQYPEVKFKRVFQAVERPVASDAEIVTAYSDGRVTLRSNRRLDGYHEAADLSGFQGVRPGDFVVHGLDILRGSAGVSDSEGAISAVCTVCIPRSDDDARFFAYAIRAQAMTGFTRAMARGIREGGADFRRWETLGDLPLPRPAVAQQRAIADLLDAESARVEALVTARRRQIELTAERFRAVREAHLRELLAEHGAVPLKRLAWRIEQGWSPDTEAVPAEPHEWGVLKTSAVSTGEFDGSQNKKLPDGVGFDSRWAIKDGDLLVVRGSGSPGAVAQAAVAVTGGRQLLLPDLLYRVVLRVGDARFLAHALASRFARDQFEAAIRTDVGMTRKIRSEDLANVLVPAAPVPIQARFLESLEDESGETERVLEVAQRQVDLLLERSRALIIAAVTGQIEIPGVAA